MWIKYNKWSHGLFVLRITSDREQQAEGQTVDMKFPYTTQGRWMDTVHLMLFFPAGEPKHKHKLHMC